MNALARLYDQDYYAWTRENARLLREGRVGEIDFEHLAEEVESMGASERSQLQNRHRVLLAHLLKWQYQPQYRGRSWSATIKEQRLSIQMLLADNPSLKSQEEDRIAKAYPLAVQTAIRETNLDEKTFPVQCPYSRAQIADPEFYPE